jgi:hypothetical protein
MNNEFLTTITFLKDLLISDADINVVTHGVSNDIDLDKKTNYPLAHIQFLNFSNETDGIVGFNFEIHILKIRDINKTPSTDKWLRNDNELDNYNMCVAIANRLLLKLKQNNDFDIEVLSKSQPEVISLEFLNMLDGVKFQLQLGITNNVSGC